MMKKFSLFLLLFLSIFISSTSLAHAGCEPLTQLNFDDSDPEALVVSWQPHPDHIGYEVSIKGDVDTFSFYTTQDFFKLNSSLIDNNSGGILQITVTPDCGGGNYATSIGTPIVEVEIIYDLCEEDDFDPSLSYMIVEVIYASGNSSTARIGLMRGECICSYRNHSNVRFPLYINANTTTLPPCGGSECASNFQNDEKYFKHIFTLPNATHYMNNWQNNYCKKVSPYKNAPTFEREEDQSPTFSLYPNPTSGLVFAENKAAQSIKTQAIVYNSAGLEVLRTGTDSSAGYEIDLSGFSSGVYLISIVSDTEVLHQEKIIKL